MILADLTTPLTWQFWRPFRGIHRWLLYRGCPPTIRKLTGLTRIIHLTVLVCALSLLSGVAGAVSVWFSMKAMGPGDDTGLAVFGTILGLGVIAPVSRWIGRAWWHVLAGVVFSAIWFGVIDSLHSFYGQMLPHNSWHSTLHWGLTTTTWCLGMAAWMIDVRQPRTWWMIMLGTGAGVIATASKSCMEQFERSGTLTRIPFGHHELTRFLINFQPILVMLVLLCASLGLRLWWDHTLGEIHQEEVDREDASGVENGLEDQGVP